MWFARIEHPRFYWAAFASCVGFELADIFGSALIERLCLECGESNPIFTDPAGHIMILKAVTIKLGFVLLVLWPLSMLISRATRSWALGAVPFLFGAVTTARVLMSNYVVFMDAMWSHWMR